ncbi:MAG: exodeoxyribonuclease VII large subunit, partial [Bdellovibrionales bacterium]|nr:exodeoxyribonuclease VII large subunit [Bdellovibrionales bacterium]
PCAIDFQFGKSLLGCSAMTNSSHAVSNSMNVLSVSELTRALNELVEGHFFDIVFTGEISQCTLASSGHLYFTVKDAQSQIRSVMWRGSAARLTFKPEEGLAVLCTARANVYPKSGQLQMVVSHMELAGKGDLHQRFLKLKAQLEQEGLFDPSRKRSLPFFPKTIGVVTSKSGAVIHDIMTKILERMPQTQVYLIDVRVQGDGAAEEIAAAIDRFNKLQNVEVLIVGRGGGSLEDLWPFNEEVVVRSIFRSKIPVISAVGHEVDVTLSDLVADSRAPTPTAAAEMAVPDRKQLRRELEKLANRLIDRDRWLMPLGQALDDLTLQLQRAGDRFFERNRARLDSAALRVQSIRPSQLLQLLNERVTTLDARLSQCLRSFLNGLKQQVIRFEARLPLSTQRRELSGTRLRLQQLEKRLTIGVQANYSTRKQMTSALSARLEALSYKSTLARGYSIVRHEGQILSESSKSKPQDVLDISLHRGKLSAVVSDIE